MGSVRLLCLPVAALLLCSGCVVRPTYTTQPEACRAARASLPSLQRGGLSAAELMQVTSPDARAYRYAKSARDQGIVWTAMTVIGSGLLLSGLLMGFVTDPSQTDVRTAGYGMAISAIGVGAVATAVGITGPRAARKSMHYFVEYAEHCRESVIPPTELPPPGTPVRPPMGTSGEGAGAEAAPGPPRGEPYVPTPPPQ